MNKILLVCAMVLFATTTIAEENKTITPQEFANTIIQTPGKLVTFIQGEVEKTKDYQAKSWASAKEQSTNNWNTIKGWFGSK
ncbi:MAG: hypothetical protein CMH03_00160 [Marinovum sp.]|nr:hypothetical protein [Marinovum sp.]|tara:strand:+ start:3743 stop:3988 length:246 start_codon:yes stop_codon:yes gene_type:complete